MKNRYAYDEIFQRNIGVFTVGEQERIKNLKVAIAGVGGIGGPVAYNLARLGVGEIRLADPDFFEITNINRQSGAYVDTVGVNKAIAVENELKRINPHLHTNIIESRVERKNVDDFIRGSDVILDGIDFFEPKDSYDLAIAAKKHGIWVYTAQCAKEIHSCTSYDPKGIGFEELVVDNNGPSIEKSISSFFPVLPRGVKQTDVKKLLESGAIHISSHATPPNMGGAIVADLIIRQFCLLEEPICVAPNVLIFNQLELTSKIIKVL